MKSGFIIALIVLSICLNHQVNAQNDLFKFGIKKYFESFLNNPQMQLNFIREFIKGMILSEIRLYDLSLNQSNKLGSEATKKIQNEMNGFIGFLFQDKYTNLQALVDHIKESDPKALGTLFTESNFKKDIQSMSNQQQLAEQILKQLYTTTDAKQTLTESIKNLDQIKKFLVKYKGLQEEEIEKSFEYLKDPKKIKNSMDFLVDKLGDKDSTEKLLKLFMKYKDLNKGGLDDPLKMIQDDPALMELLADKNWEELLKLKDQMTAIGGKAFKDYQNNNGNNRDSDDEDEDEDDEEGREGRGKSHGARVVLIIFAVIILAGVGFLIYRKCRQMKYNDGTESENKQLYRAPI